MGKRRPKASEVAAIEDMNKKIKLARNKANFKELADLCNSLGNQHRLLGNYEEAEDCHAEEIKLTKTYNKADKKALAIAYRNMGETLSEMNQIAKAIKYTQQYLKVAKEAGSYVEEQRALITLGRTFLRMADNEDESPTSGDESKLSYEEALRKAEKCFRAAYKLLDENLLKDEIGNEKDLMRMKCNNCQNLGTTLDQKGQLEDAKSWIMKGIDIGSKYQFHDYLAPLYDLLSGLYLRTRKPNEALSKAKEATKTAKLLGNEQVEVESQIMEARALIMLNEDDAAKKLLTRLRRTVKKKSHLDGYLETLDPLLTAVVRVCRTKDVLATTGENEPEKKMGLNEMLGDNYTTLSNYETAISHYKKSCQYADMAGVAGKKLSRLYFSIAESYRDLEEYQNAYDYYLKEMSMHRENPSEEFKTQTNITFVLEKMKKHQDQIIEAHEVAVDLAKLTKNLSKEITARKNFASYLSNIGRQTESDRQFAIVTNIQEEHNISEEDEQEADSQDLLDEEYVDLDALTTDEESDDEADDDRRAKQNSFKIRRNEAGETKLHLAAKKGDLKAVRRLLREGHPVKIQDTAGWSPLHEACNYGHAAVVEELLKHKADVNAVDGSKYSGDQITPLHDAASNCHCEVIKVLLKYGANATLRDKQKRYPIESLIAWKNSEASRDCSEQDLVAYEDVKQLLKKHMAKAGKVFSSKDEKNRRHKSNPRNQGPQLSLLVEKPRDIDCPIPVRIVTDDFDPDEEGDGKKLYERTMKQVRRREPEKSAKEKGRPISPGPRGALIPAELDVNDDWLLPDGEIFPEHKKDKAAKPKRKRDPLDDVGDRCTTQRRRRKKSSHCLRDALPEFAMDTDEDNSDRMDYEPSVSGREEQLEHEQPTTSRTFLPEAEKNTPDFEDDDEEFSTALLDLDSDVLAFSSVPQDNFLPSQRPVGSAVEFGKTVDVVEVFDKDQSDDSSNGFRSRRKNLSPAQSSDEDDFTRDMSSSRQSYRLSEIASSLKQKTGKDSRNERRRMVQTRLPVQAQQSKSKFIVTRNVVGRTSSSSNSSPDDSTTGKRSMRRAPSSSSFQSHVQVREKAVRLLTVRILDKALRVPVEDAQLNESIDWLAAECSARYLNVHGVKPILTLQTKDGASLSGTDSISLVLEANERELVGLVSSFDLPPLMERYCTSCKNSGVEPDPKVKSSLNDCQSSNILNLCDVYLRGKNSIVVMNSLQQQSALRTLILSGCSLFDNGFIELCKILPTLPNLMELDVRLNGITKLGFLALTKAFSQANLQSDSMSSQAPPSVVPFGLTSLVLSHNPLGNSIGNSLATLLSCLRALKRLEMADCNFSEKLFTWGKADLPRALTASRLEDLDISFNNFNEIGGLELFLKHLPARLIKSLNCSSCTTSDNGNDVAAKALCNFLSGNEDCCKLKSLRLSDCNLKDKSLNMILENFDRLVNLESFDVACNDNLTVTSLQNILERSTDMDIPLSHVNMESIPYLWDTASIETKEMILNTIERKMSTSNRLATLRLPSKDVNPEFSDTNEEFCLSKIEKTIISKLEDFAGMKTFYFKKQGANITYGFEG